MLGLEVSNTESDSRTRKPLCKSAVNYGLRKPFSPVLFRRQPMDSHVVVGMALVVLVMDFTTPGSNNHQETLEKYGPGNYTAHLGHIVKSWLENLAGKTELRKTGSILWGVGDGGRVERGGESEVPFFFSLRFCICPRSGTSPFPSPL